MYEIIISNGYLLNSANVHYWNRLMLQVNNIYYLKMKIVKLFFVSLGNPFKLPRPATIAKGTQAILEHLRNQLIE
jgi:hypothetical protein